MIVGIFPGAWLARTLPSPVLAVVVGGMVIGAAPQARTLFYCPSCRGPGA